MGNVSHAIPSSEVTLFVTRVVSWLFSLDLALWFGAAVYFSFFAAPALFSGLDPDTAGRAVGLLFPTYFRLCAVLAPLGWLLAAIVFRFGSGPTRAARIAAHVLFGLGTVAAWLDAFVLLPWIERIEARMGPVSHADPALYRQFGMLHGLSMVLDLIAILCAGFIWLCLEWRSREGR
jgi:hypothetical protein